MGPEPTLIIQAIVAALVAANTAIATRTDIPWWVSLIISVAIVFFGALVNRSQVTPNSKVASVADGPEPSQAELAMKEDLNPDEWLANRKAAAPVEESSS